MNIFYKYFWKDKYYSIRDYLFPRNEWLTIAIPNKYLDKDDLIEIVLFKCLTEFVEQEIGEKELFNKGRWKSDENFGEAYKEMISYQVKFEDELKDIYLIATKTLPNLEKELQLAWRKVPKFKFDGERPDYDQTYGEVDRLEKEINDLKTDVMKWVVENRGHLWT